MRQVVVVVAVVILSSCSSGAVVETTGAVTETTEAVVETTGAVVETTEVDTDSSATDPIEVTGTEVCRQIADDGLSSSYECEDQTSDPRVSGTMALTVVMEQAPPTALSGTIELVNDGGTWVGSWTGEITTTNNHIADAVLVGTGEYDGFEYDARWEGVDYPLTITGTIRASE